MHSHMEEDGGGGAPGGYKLLRECGDIHSLSLKLLISLFLMIYDKSEILGSSESLSC